MLPAQVISYAAATNLAQVQPLIVMVTTDNIQVKRGQIASVPVYQYGGGGFVAKNPITKGDLGWIKANDRDISLFKQSHLSAPPNTQRKHSFSDAMFFPDTMFQGFTFAGEDVDNFVIQNKAGTVKISWWQNLIKMVAPGVGINTTPNANAYFDVAGTTKASMPFPRMTTGQRDAIPSPTEGMCVWNLSTHGISVYNGSVWS
ncbi:MAG: hypothetical protein B7Z19_03120 [Polynucleobacter sp. 32-46-5]|nr:MAG: hypothetical protein B7Z19_03120 [Polynucleobacter sp. 32-46-5]